MRALPKPAEVQAGDRIQLNSLTSLRFAAASIVLAHHAFSMLMPGSKAAQLTDAGFVGVSFFFALSGFILTWTHNPKLLKRHFYGRRVARLAPLHYGTAIVAMVYLVLVTGEVPLLPSLSNLLLIHAWIPAPGFGSSLNPVSWSLACEAFFYLCFPFLVSRITSWNRRRVVVGVSLGLVAVAAVVLASLPQYTAVQVLYENPVYRMGAFVLGIALAKAMKSGCVPKVGIRTAAIICIVALGFCTRVIPLVMTWGWPPARVYADLIFLPSALLLIAAAAQSDLAGSKSILRHPWLVALGEASFALYMIHYLMLQIFVELYGDPSARPGVYFVVAGFCAVAILCSIAIYRWFERPAERRLRARLGRPVAQAETPLSRT